MPSQKPKIGDVVTLKCECDDCKNDRGIAFEIVGQDGRYWSIQSTGGGPIKDGYPNSALRLDAFLTAARKVIKDDKSTV